LGVTVRWESRRKPLKLLKTAMAIARERARVAPSERKGMGVAKSTEKDA
jgi:hypothetical protein